MATQKAITAPVSIQSYSSSELGAWSNSYLIAAGSEAILFDACMLHSDAAQIADVISKSGKTLKTVMVSHAHPDHFMGLDVIASKFPHARITSTRNVVADIAADGPRMFSLLQSKLVSEGPTRLVIPEPLDEPILRIEGFELEVIEFGEGESKHTAALHIPTLNALLSADLVYNNAHLYLQERHQESWLTRLDELEAFAKNKISTIYPGHGSGAGLELIAQTRSYLRDFNEAVKSGDAKTAEQRMLAKYPEFRVRQFLSQFSIPAYFPAA